MTCARAVRFADCCALPLTPVPNVKVGLWFTGIGIVVPVLCYIVLGYIDSLASLPIQPPLLARLVRELASGQTNAWSSVDLDP